MDSVVGVRTKKVSTGRNYYLRRDIGECPLWFTGNWILPGDDRRRD